MLTKKYTVIILISFILLLNVSIFVQADEPVDISNHWAQDYILDVLNNDSMTLYSDNTFRPNQNIARGEFARSLAKQLNFLTVNSTQFNDLQNYPGQKHINTLVAKNIINGYPDGTFKPEESLTKAEAITIMIKAIGIKKDEVKINLDQYKPFTDISNNHWAANQVKIANKLDLILENDNNKFYPDHLITRAEAARYLTKLKELSGKTGYLTDVYPTSGKISVNLLNGDRKIYNISDQTVIGRNNRIVDIKEILETDKVFIVADNNKDAKYIKGYGMVTKDDLAAEVSQMTNNILDPEEVENLSKGNLNILKPKLQETVKEQLINQGLNSSEVNAIMNTRWNELEELSKNRLSEAIAIQTGLPLDITRGVMDGDWDKIKTYAQIEVVQRMVQEVLNSELIS